MVWCYDRSATHVSVLAMSCFRRSYNPFAWFGVAGVVLKSLGDACLGVSNGVFSLKLQPVCVVLVLLVCVMIARRTPPKNAPSGTPAQNMFDLIIHRYLGRTCF